MIAKPYFRRSFFICSSVRGLCSRRGSGDGGGRKGVIEWGELLFYNFKSNRLDNLVFLRCLNFCASEVCASEVCASEVCASEVCASEVCVCEVCVCEVCVCEVCASEVCASEVCASEVCASEVCA